MTKEPSIWSQWEVFITDKMLPNKGDEVRLVSV